MSDALIPDRFMPAIRWVIAGIALFVFFLEAADSFREGELASGFVFVGLFVVTLPIAIWWNAIGQYFGGRKKASAAPKATADRFYDVPFQHLENLGWSSLIDVANKARAENAETPFGRSLSGVPIQEKTSIYAGKIGGYVQLYGCPPLWHAPSEPIKERGDQIRFRLNGGQMDSTDANGKSLYRNIWLHTVDVPKALQLVRVMATEYKDKTL
ncbi:MAG: hypothetical protein WB760_06935 [Xanthobacteraceae bacterium]